MRTTSASTKAITKTSAITDEWIAEHFDLLSPVLVRELHPTLAPARVAVPGGHSDQHGGYWIATRYEDVLRTGQD